MSVPALRFPEFEGEWEEKRLGNMFPKVRNGFVGTATPYYETNGIPYLQGKNIKTGAIDPKGLIRIKDTFHEKQKKSQLKAGDLLMVQSGHVGECAVVTEEFAGGNCHALVVMTPNASVEPEFMRDLFYAPVGQQHIRRIKTGNTIEHVLTSDLKPLQLVVPSLPEQKKIAAFLGVVDEKLAGLRARRDELERYKRGLMQKLFSRTLRFTKPDGSAFPDWEEKRLGDVGTIFGGLSGKSGDDFGVGQPFVTYKQVFDSSKIDHTKFGLVRIGSNEKQNKVIAGDILFTTSSETPSEVGFSSVMADFDGDVYLNSFCFGMRPNDQSRFLPDFAQYLFRAHEYRKSCFPLAQGSTRYNLSKKSFVKIKLYVPHPAEQTLIADALQAMDAKIQAVSDQITRMEAFKKGLLQQMFV